MSPEPSPQGPADAEENGTYIERATAAPIQSKARATLPLSSLEHYYADRLGESITLFGYETFRRIPAKDRHESVGAPQDSYILGPGDEVSVIIRGHENITRSFIVTDEGLLVIEDLQPVSAAGRSLKSVREELQSLLGDYYNTDIHLSLTKTRQIAVLITGNVANPGEITLSSFDTVMDALAKAGGIEKTGTLRQIKLIRGKTSSIVDLYGVLMYGSGTSDFSLRDGDTIQVGPIGPTIAITGAVKRPGIYEILPARQTISENSDDAGASSQKLSLNDLMFFAGGAITPGQIRYTRSTPDDSGKDIISDVTERDLKIFRDGDILSLSKKKETRADSVELLGHSRADGVYALSDTPTLSALLANDTVPGPDIYPLIGVIQRWNPNQLSKELMVFSPRNVIARESDMDLHESDRIILFSQSDIASLGSPKSRDPQSGEELRQTAEKTDSDETESGKVRAGLKDFLLEHSVFIRGSVRYAGSYPIADGTTLETLLAVAGGPSFEANTGDIELTQPLADKTARRTNIDIDKIGANGITLHPGDTIRVNTKFKKVEDTHVLLAGEIRNPGTYDLLPGDTLGKLIARAGGITEQAYPDGAIFSRKSERLREEERFKSTARDLELKLTSALSQKDPEKKPDDDEISLAKSLIADLKNADALGRLTVEADPSMLTTNPETDILLENGDRIFIPKRPLTVRVAGEVLSPAALQFRSGKKPNTYIDEAGGFTYNADQDRAFVVYPDGSASPLAVSAWNQSATMIPPGSTIIVPRDPKPLSFMDGAKDLSQILANLATTAIFAEDVTNDD